MRQSLVIALILTPVVHGRAPAPSADKVKPGQVAVSKPDGSGLVTMLRPVVTRLHASDPFRIALHWATEKGPLPPHRDMRPFARFATLRTMTFTVTTPDGKRHEVQAEVPPETNDWNGGLYYSPTYLLSLTRTGLSHHQAYQPDRDFAWSGKKTLDLDRAGVYKVRVSGAITDGKAKGIPFESEEVSLDIGIRGHRPLAGLVKEARETIGKKVPVVANVKVESFVTEDREGNRIVRFRASGMKWNYLDYYISFRPDGTPQKQWQREVFNCIAQGTRIETENGLKPIEQVREGDRVWGFDGTKRVLTTVRVAREGTALETLRFGGLRVTTAHPLWSDGLWKPAGEVQKGERLLDPQMRKVTVGRPERVTGVVTVYDLTVDAPHCFFAGGFLVHNKDRAYSPKLDDPWYDLWGE